MHQVCVLGTLSSWLASVRYTRLHFCNRVRSRRITDNKLLFNLPLESHFIYYLWKEGVTNHRIPENSALKEDVSFILLGQHSTENMHRVVVVVVVPGNKEK